MNKIKVLVVDDSAFMRKVVSDILSSSSDIEVVGKARDGMDALEKIKQLQPHVVTMDVEMPVMDGLTALEKIMTRHPLPVIMLSSLTKQGADLTMKALELGAVDFIAKPSGQISLDIETVKDDIVNKVIMAAGTRKKLSAYVSPPAAVVKERQVSPVSQTLTTGNTGTLRKLLVIGTSTGGPKALHEVIPRLPRHIDAGILIVQHMPPNFTRSLADRLNSLSQVKVKEAEQGEPILPGCAYVAPGDYHLKVEARNNRGVRELLVHLDQSPTRNGHRPAADVMMESAAQSFWGPMVAVVMTGMGSDGAAGLVRIKERGGKTIAEHQSTCVVYGMPKAAAETGCVDQVVPLHDIGAAIERMINLL